MRNIFKRSTAVALVSTILISMGPSSSYAVENDRTIGTIQENSSETTIFVFDDKDGDGVFTRDEAKLEKIEIQTNLVESSISDQTEIRTPYNTTKSITGDSGEISVDFTQPFQVSVAPESLPVGYGIDAAHNFETYERQGLDAVAIPVRKIASVDILLSHEVVDMRVPYLPQMSGVSYDAFGNSLGTRDGILTTSANVESGTVIPDSLADGIVTVTYTVDGISVTREIPYTFSEFSIVGKLNYALSRQWISEEKYKEIYAAAERNIADVPIEYQAEQLSEEGEFPPMFVIEEERTPHAATDSRNNAYFSAIGNSTQSTLNTAIDYAVEARTKLSGLGYTVPTKKITIQSKSMTGWGEADANTDTISFASSLTAGTNLKYTIFHEYFHMVQQLNYNGNKSNDFYWWMEASSDWFGRAYAGHTHYAESNNISPILNNPEYPISFIGNWTASATITTDYRRGYGSATLAMFLESKASGSVRNVWNSYRDHGVNRTNAVHLSTAIGSTTWKSYLTEYFASMYKPYYTFVSSYKSDFSSSAEVKHVKYVFPDSTSGISSQPLTTLYYMGAVYHRIQTTSNATRNVVIVLPTLPSGVTAMLIKKDASGNWAKQSVSSGTTVTISGYNTSVKELAIVFVNTNTGGSTITVPKFTVKVTT